MNIYEQATQGKEPASAALVTWWKPNEGETIGGKVTYIGERTTSFGDQQVIEILDDEGETMCRPINGQMENEMSMNGVNVGHVIALKYCGKRTAEKSGREYNVYFIAKFDENGQPIEAGDNNDPPKQEALIGESDDEFQDDIPF